MQGLSPLLHRGLSGFVKNFPTDKKPAAPEMEETTIAPEQERK